MNYASPSLSRLRDAEIILDCIADGVMTIDLQKRVTFLNRAMKNLLGFRGELSEQVLACDVLVQSEICSSQDCVLERALRGERVDNFETFVKRHDGRLIPVSVNTDFLRDEGGQLMGLIEVIRDMSSTRELSQVIVEVNELKNRLEDQVNAHNMIGESRIMREIFAKLPAMAASSAATLITGESGTGKELLAYALHALGLRKHFPFVVVNCSSLSEGVLESEIFGHVKGAFTGAYYDKVGRFERAHRGTVFLDEVADIPLSTQVKLLRILESGHLERVGSNDTIHIDVRLVAATHQDLSAAVKAGTFREDLFYRIRVLAIDLPPLRSRMDDLPLFINYYLEKFNGKMKKHVRQISPKALEALMQYHFPGNIRELRNIMEHAFVCCDDTIIRFEDLPREIQHYRILHTKGRGSESLKNIEREAIYHVLSQTGWKYAEASKKLGIGRSTLWRKMKSYSIENIKKNVSN
ncbi:MAG: sigma 54-interacting transcriptional regulator [Nitrospirales bacterium]|nr:sigma 54-interacting transcriptional regulator [Nitrospira sp.]MDR4503064.1 sigma 54-interacting transcriptional regulator [Nitrospirales bacterium]